MPTSVTFFYHLEHWEQPTMTVNVDGSVEEHGMSFLRRRQCVARLERRTVGPTRAQLDAVQQISALAIKTNPYCVLTYKCFTSPWGLDSYEDDECLRQTLGPRLPPGSFQPRPKQKPSNVIYLRKRYA
jgi:hypothetical protein